ncbi:MAG: hypothetical protein CL678_08360 [Bdellovibrionaceae bacterium]|nr:hypothetical protein [Pseudobdellovibrionaceae bacterium]|tara:strand:+ start:599 stop:1657 length:1059 start_codon:yes stop_codon:yes gene_type:complete
MNSLSPRVSQKKINKKKKKVMVLIDLPFEAPEDHDYRDFEKDPDWKSELAVMKQLKKMGYDAHLFGLHDNINDLISMLQTQSYDFVFNLCESYKDDREYEGNIASLLEVMEIPFTGANARALNLCKDKALTKKILKFHGLDVPEFQEFPLNKKIKIQKNFPYPGVVKPVGYEGSEGIHGASLVKNEKEALKRIEYVQSKYKVDVLMEEYIHGREVYISLIGNKKVQAFHPQELFFDNMPEDMPRLASFKAKWDPKYRKKWDIDNGPVFDMDPALEKSIMDYGKKVYKIFGLNGYARFDLRVTDNGKIYFLEANPNPSIAPGDDFEQAAKESGVSYRDLLSQVIRLSKKTGNA